jgi:hypothetical protein
VASIVAVGGVIYKWVDNKGKSERAAHPEA